MPRSSGSRRLPAASATSEHFKTAIDPLVEDWISIQPTRKPEEPL